MTVLPGKKSWILWPVPGVCDTKECYLNYRYQDYARYDKRWGESKLIVPRGDVVTASTEKENAL